MEVLPICRSRKNLQLGSDRVCQRKQFLGFLELTKRFLSQVPPAFGNEGAGFLVGFAVFDKTRATCHVIFDRLDKGKRRRNFFAAVTFDAIEQKKLIPRNTEVHRVQMLQHVRMRLERNAFLGARFEHHEQDFNVERKNSEPRLESFGHQASETQISTVALKQGFLLSGVFPASCVPGLPKRYGHSTERGNCCECFEQRSQRMPAWPCCPKPSENAACKQGDTEATSLIQVPDFSFVHGLKPLSSAQSYRWPRGKGEPLLPVGYLSVERKPGGRRVARGGGHA